jgi:SAM-dependent methyltransferase
MVGSTPSSIELVSARCCICETADAEPVGLGEDFEYRSCPDTFLAVRCLRCGLVYLDPRPAVSELARIYPPSYHAFEFSEAGFGVVYHVRRRLEARRLMRFCRRLPEQARILDVGCGDGFHLEILRDFGEPGWQLEGVDIDSRAVAAARAKGLTVHHGKIEAADLPAAAYDLAFIIATIEHVGDPRALLRAVHDRLRPGGRAVVVTDNTATLDFRLFGGRHWGGYHFPRHWYLFEARTLRLLAATAGLEALTVETIISPVNWAYSIRNALADFGAPTWAVERFGLDQPVTLAALTAFDALHWLTGRGALLRAVLRRPSPAAEA